MFACVGPAAYNYDETLSTLRYANRAKNIQNHAKVNEDPKDALMRKYQKEIEELRKMLEEGSDPEGSTEDDDEDSDDDDVAVEGGESPTKRQQKKKFHHLSEDQLASMRKQLEEERSRIKDEKSMAAEERDQAEVELKRREEELLRAQSDHDAMRQKLAALERKIIVGKTSEWTV